MEPCLRPDTRVTGTARWERRWSLDKSDFVASHDPRSEFRASGVLALVVAGDRVEPIGMALYLIAAYTWGNLLWILAFLIAPVDKPPASTVLFPIMSREGIQRGIQRYCRVIGEGEPPLKWGILLAKPNNRQVPNHGQFDE